MLKRLRLKFICINMMIITLMLGIIFFLIIYFTYLNVTRVSEEMLQRVAFNPTYLSYPNDASQIYLPYFTIRLDEQKKPIEVFGGNLNLTEDKTFLQEIIRLSFDSSEKTGLLKEQHLRFLKIDYAGEPFIIFLDIYSEITTMKNLIQNCILIGIISFFIFLGISNFFARWAVRPVEAAWKQQKQFMSDASHELKTPLSVIMTNAQLLQSTSFSENQKETFRNHIQVMAVQMRKLIESMLQLARIDSGLMYQSMECVNWSNLLEEEVYPFEPLFFENNLKLETDIEKNIFVKGHKNQLRQIPQILLDNALKYAEPETYVKLKLTKSTFTSVLSVSSFGKMLTEKEQEQIFQRFYRGESRQCNGSYGLGLSIAKSIIDEHHGKIWVESKEGMNIFYVQLNHYK